MNLNNKMLKTAVFILMVIVVGTSCKKLSRPALGDFPKDADPRFPLYPGGPLKFFTAFDGTTSNPLMNAVDSIRASLEWITMACWSPTPPCSNAFGR